MVRRPKTLVANRGEIAVRVLRALRELGCPTVAVHSDPDAQCPHARIADEAVSLPGCLPAETYLDIEKLLEAARLTGAEAVHPGYGFLAENPRFREACDRAGLLFIGPPASAMRTMGNKLPARQAMAAAGVPVVPGSMRPAADVDTALSDAREVGFPVMLKAAAGGGGKGLRRVDRESDLPKAFENVTRVAQAAFGDGTLYVEKALRGPRHIEVQVLADRHGGIVHLFERSCSVQRRHQKVVEEAPAPGLAAAVRDGMCEVAVRAARAIGYEGAGTVEFLVDDEDRAWFMEMNTRLQVEHPVTEAVLGVDLVQAMIRVALGEPVPWRQEDLVPRGHAVECRVNTEDPHHGFLPSPGRLFRYARPGGPFVRVDDGVDEGGEVSAFYDPLLAKVTTWAEDREGAIRRMERALEEFEIGGVPHNLPFLLHVLQSREYRSGRFDTGLVERIGPLPPVDILSVEDAAVALAARALWTPAAVAERASPEPSAWRRTVAAATRRWG